MTSKYDQYWAARLGEIRDALGRAAGGFPAMVATPGLRDLGDRQSWYGLAEVRAGDTTRSSMAHATSLGRTIAASGICAQWPRDTFRLVVHVAGDALTITTSQQDSRAGKTARHEQGHRPPAAFAGDSPPAPAARAVPAPPVPAGVMAGPAGPGEFYRLLAELARLAGARGGCGIAGPATARPAASTSSSKTARSAAMAAAASCGSARTR